MTEDQEIIRRLERQVAMLTQMVMTLLSPAMREHFQNEQVEEMRRQQERWRQGRVT